MALELLCAARPRERRRPLTELDRQEQVQAATLRYLIEHGSVATPAQLIEFFGFSHARLTKILTELEAEELVHRDSDPVDRRRVIVRLTEQGFARATAQREELLEYLMKLLELLGPEDAEHLMRIAGKIQNADMTPTFGCCTTERKRT